MDAHGKAPPLKAALLDPLMDVEETARTLGVNSRMVRSLIQKGELLSIRVGRLIRISKADLEAYIKRNRR